MLRGACFSTAAFLGVLLCPVFFNRIYVCDDLLNYHLPIRQFYADCLRQGHSFDWMPQLFSGYFLTGSGQAGTWHPWHILLYRFVPLPIAFGLEILSSYPFMLCGMLLFLRRHFQQPAAIRLGAVVFTFSGFCTLHFLHPNAVAVVSHIPWLLALEDIVLRGSVFQTSESHGDKVRPQTTVNITGNHRKTVAASAGIALLTGSQLLLGYPQYVWFSLLAEVVCCIGFGIGSQHGLRKLLQISVMKMLGLGLGAVQLLPSMEALSESDRGEMPPEYFFQYPLTAPDLLQWVHPFLTRSRVFGVHTHELGLYCGAIPLLLAGFALLTIRKQTAGRRLLLVMSVLGLLSLWLSFGKDGGLYVLQTRLPLVGKFRWPSRIICLLHLVTATLAAVGLNRILNAVPWPNADLPSPRSDTETVGGSEPSEFRAFKVWLSVVPCLSVLAIFLTSCIVSPAQQASRPLLLIGPVLFFLAGAQLRELILGRASFLFFVFVTGDLAAYGYTYEAMNRTRSMAEIIDSLSVPPGSPHEGRIIAETHISDSSIGFGGNQRTLAGWYQADGYEGLMPRTYLLHDELTMDGLRVAGVRWVVNAGRHATIAGLRPTEDPLWLEVPHPLPRVRLTNSVTIEADPARAARIVSAEGPVIVDDLPGAMSALKVTRDEEAGIPRKVRIRHEAPGHVMIDVQTSSAAVLVLAERHSPNWTVRINDRSSAVLRAEADFMGCMVPPGDSVIEFRFEARSVIVGQRISLMSLAALILWMLFQFAAGSVRKQNRTDVS